jgi:hypothetical protein
MFSYDGVVTAVRIVEETDLSRRNSVLEAVLSSTSLTNQVNRVYLALPKLLSAAIDGSIVEEHGIGLMVFDETTLEEVVAPKHFQAKKNSPAPVGEESYKILRDEITNLRTRIDSLEDIAESMRSEITRLRSLRCSPPQIGTTSISSSASLTKQTPSFMKDNPWVEVLSRRGQEGDRYVS